MVDDTRWMYSLGMIWFSLFNLPGGHGDPRIEFTYLAKPSVCKTGLLQSHDKLAVNACVHYPPWSRFPWHFCLEIFQKNTTDQVEWWQPVYGCKVCLGHYCVIDQPYICFCYMDVDNRRCYHHNDFANTVYSETIWRAELSYAYTSRTEYIYVYSKEIKIPPIYSIKWANFSIDGEKLSLNNCTKKFPNLGTRTLTFCAMGLVNPFVSMTLGILELPHTENSMCITRSAIVPENKHLQVHLNYSEHHDECDIHKSYKCDLYFTDCSTKVENPVSLSVDGKNLLSTPVCEMKLTVGKKHFINFCRDELKEAVLQVMKNNIWTNTTQQCIQVDLIVDAVSTVSYIFHFIDLCRTSRVYKCLFSGFVRTEAPVTLQPNTTCFDCDKEITTPCYYCDEDSEELPSYVIPLIMTIALLLIIGSIACYLRINKKCFWKKGGRVDQSEMPSRSEAKLSQATGYEYDSSEFTSDSEMNSETAK